VAPEGFAGAPRDGETATSGWLALNYLGARHLHSASGRFTTVDPLTIDEFRLLDPQQQNLYAYDTVSLPTNVHAVPSAEL
jgi:hypothetical protein